MKLDGPNSVKKKPVSDTLLSPPILAVNNQFLSVTYNSICILMLFNFMIFMYAHEGTEWSRSKGSKFRQIFHVCMLVTCCKLVTIKLL